MAKKRAHVVVSGRVQGVWFRESTRQEAISRGISGWVRNLHDGRVEAVLEGDAVEVEKVVDFMRHGPKFASVTEARINYEEFRSEFETFLIAGSAAAAPEV